MYMYKTVFQKCQAECYLSRIKVVTSPRKYQIEHFCHVSSLSRFSDPCDYIECQETEVCEIDLNQLPKIKPICRPFEGRPNFVCFLCSSFRYCGLVAVS